MLAEPVRLLQVLTNLLSNAAKFSPKVSSVEIRALHTEGGARVSSPILARAFRKSSGIRSFRSSRRPTRTAQRKARGSA